MIEWLALTDAQRRISLEQAQINSGIIPKAIEKDWWVTLVLKALFELSYAKYFIFKGGTSLSKGWRLISRLSEDIDIALSPEAFGKQYKASPSHSYVRKIKKEGSAFTAISIKQLLEEKLNEYNLNGKAIHVYAEPVLPEFPDKDPQTIFVSYPSLYVPDKYLEDKVKIEFSVRSIKDPYEIVQIQSILSEHFPQLPYQEIPFEVAAASPHKTFIEKMCLMHEKIVKKEIRQSDVERQSRHLYDMSQMKNNMGLEKVLSDRMLYTIIVEHRKNWIRLKDIDYDQLQSKTIAFVPTEDLIEFFRDDYAKMQETMIYGNVPSFDEIIRQIKDINALINGM
jgi:hypothetical protein